jgi:general stress protein 26
MSDLNFDKLMGLLQSFETASVVTRSAADRICGRPMAIAECTTEGHLWFVTRVESATIADITEHPAVAAILQSSGRYVSISGLARTSRDGDRIDELWDPGQAVWFEKGKQDPSLILLEIVPVHGEYWDRSGLSGIDFKLREIRALITGATFGATAGEHGTVSFD